MKVLVLLLAIIAADIQLGHSATLRRKPKVYNALITTDQNLTPSRAFPIIQPHLQETYAYPSYSYRSYAPLGIYNNGFQYGSAAASYNGFHHGYPRINPGLVQGRNFFSRDEIHSTLPPISTSNFGIPSLVPINSFSFGNLAPYQYHSYPTIYDQFGGYGGYLPPYSFYPPGFDGINLDNGKKDTDGQNEGYSPANGEVESSSSNSNVSPGSGGNGGSSRPGGNNNGGSSGGNSNGGSSGGNSNGGSSGGNSNGGSSGGNSNGGSSGGNSNGGSSGFGGNNNVGSSDFGDNNNGGSSGGNGSSGSGGNSNGGSSSSGGNSNGGSSGFGGNSNGGSSGFGGGSSSSTKSSRSRNFDKAEYPHQQSLSDNIKNFPNKDPTIPDIDPSPPVRVKPLNL